ncbi:hypothetical protein OG394_20925 [Kribbella sp. NBC_01245]|uniref:hypothetical protein n=1 Tax=Kribbella sp. NBC_01245 TaxID=2903578 RepID=UPI002E2E7491|nr:hypothetical protein [Kribbella sp. NBC_01245]
MSKDDPPQTDRELYERGLALLKERLPELWRVQELHSETDGPDGLLVITTDDGEATNAVVEVKRSVGRRDLAAVWEHLRSFADQYPDSTPILFSRYLAPPVRDRLTDAGVSFVDATGNIRLQVKRPGLFLFLSDRGADSDPWRGPGRPRGDLRGPVAAKLVRALLDFDRSWRITELVNEARTSTGSAYRVVEFLEEEELIQRTGPRIQVPDWERLLRRWSQDYIFVRDNRTTRWLAPRGLESLQRRIAATGDLTYAATGTIAAAEWAHYAPTRAAMIYTTNPSAAAEAWDLRPADVGANVVLAEPADDFAFARTVVATSWGGQLAAPSQVAVDLLTGPGRNPSEGEELIGWMEQNERTWRK